MDTDLPRVTVSLETIKRVLDKLIDENVARDGLTEETAQFAGHVAAVYSVILEAAGVNSEDAILLSFGMTDDAYGRALASGKIDKTTFDLGNLP